MRLFVAFQPPPAVLGELDEAVAPLRVGWPELRWAGQERWHVTLAFLGEVSDDKLAELTTRLARAASRHSAQELVIARGSAFPNKKRARVLVAGIEGDQPEMTALSALAASVAAGARRAGAPSPDEGRRYRPHLTLARCRQPADLGDLVDSLETFRTPRWRMEEIHLIRSHPAPNPRYETLVTWPLRGPSGALSRVGASHKPHSGRKTGHNP
jgi:RNA 2',3'-cyclic 3'-phosphodiesterase